MRVPFALTIALGAVLVQHGAVARAATCSEASASLAGQISVQAEAYVAANEQCLRDGMTGALFGGATHIECANGYAEFSAACTGSMGTNCHVNLQAGIASSGFSSTVTTRLATCYPTTSCNAAEVAALNALVLAETKTTLESNGLTVSNEQVLTYECAAAPTTGAPVSTAAATQAPTTAVAATTAPVSTAAATQAPTTGAATTTAVPTTGAPVSTAAATQAPTTVAATTAATAAPDSTAAATTNAPAGTTAAPQTTNVPETSGLVASTAAPTTVPQTTAPATVAPTTAAGTAGPTTTAAPTACSIATEAVLSDQMIASRTAFGEANLGCFVGGLISPPSTPIVCRGSIDAHQANCTSLQVGQNCDVVIEFDRKAGALDWSHVKLLWPDCYPIPACSRDNIAGFEAEIIRIVEETAGGNENLPMELKNIVITANTCFDTPAPTTTPSRTRRPRLPDTRTESCRLKINLGPVISSIPVPDQVFMFEDALEALNVTVVVHNTDELDDGSMVFDVEISVALSEATLSATIALIEAKKDFLVEKYEVFKSWGGSVEPAADCFDIAAAPASGSAFVALALATVAAVLAKA